MSHVFQISPNWHRITKNTCQFCFGFFHSFHSLFFLQCAWSTHSPQPCSCSVIHLNKCGIWDQRNHVLFLDVCLWIRCDWHFSKALGCHIYKHLRYETKWNKFCDRSKGWGASAAASDKRQVSFSPLMKPISSWSTSGNDIIGKHHTQLKHIERIRFANS